MMQLAPMERNLRIRSTINMDESLKKEIQDMADEKKWSFPNMAYELLKFAVQEKKRKRRGKESGSE